MGEARTVPTGITGIEVDLEAIGAQPFFGRRIDPAEVGTGQTFTADARDTAISFFMTRAELPFAVISVGHTAKKRPDSEPVQPDKPEPVEESKKPPEPNEDEAGKKRVPWQSERTPEVERMMERMRRGRTGSGNGRSKR